MKRFPSGHATHPQWRMAVALVLAQLRAQMALPEYASAPHESAVVTQPTEVPRHESVPGEQPSPHAPPTRASQPLRGLRSQST